jgi:hypothetical protein
MPEAAADKVSADALLADAIKKMDALTKRMDALEVGEKHIIKGDDDDDKKSKSDSKATSSRGDDDDDDKKDDAITAPKTKILDSEKTDAKTDAGFPPSKMKKDDDGDLEVKHKGKDDLSKKDDDDDDKKDDAFPPLKKAKDDAFPPPKKGKVKDDDDDDDKKDDAVKADALTDLRKQVSDQAEVIYRLQAMVKPRSDDEHAAFADTQARADQVFAGFGERAPRPLEGEHLVDYRKRLATKLKKHSTTWGKVKLSELPESAFQIAEDTIYNDAISAAANPADLAAGELRMVTKIDPATGVRTNVFYGKESFVKQMGRPGRRVQSFRTLASQ